jgi:putative multicomponent Na+:H+ antiporter subunit B
MDSYIYMITALFPITAAMVIFQTNPYHALVLRGVLGAIAALVYTLYGAADVALTEALVGTLLAITLYAIAVRSSLVFHLGISQAAFDQLKGKAINNPNQSRTPELKALMQDVRQVFKQHYMTVDLFPYASTEELHQALRAKEVHAICLRSPSESDYHITTRLPRLYEILQSELTTASVQLAKIQPEEVDASISLSKSGGTY